MPSRSRLRLAAASVAAVAAVAGCGSTASTAPGPGTAGSTPASGALIGAARCAANRAAGRITYLSGFQWTATVGTIDVVAAAARGYYRDMCLDVALQAGTGDPTLAAQTTASGTSTIAEVGGASDVVTAVSHGIKVKAVATYGNVAAITLITMATTTDLRQLEGKTLGYKGTMPPTITALLTRAGVDVTKIKEVKVGYDPTILPRGQVQALTGYKSNEVPSLIAAGFKVTEWDPERYGITGTFNTLVANPAFASAHPMALQDFLRATFKAYDYCHTNIDTCLAAEATISETGFETASNKARWGVESKLADRSAPTGKGVGAQSVAQFTPEAQLLAADKLITSVPDLSTVVDPSYFDAVHRGASVVWPAP